MCYDNDGAAPDLPPPPFADITRGRVRAVVTDDRRPRTLITTEVSPTVLEQDQHSLLGDY